MENNAMKSPELESDAIRAARLRKESDRLREEAEKAQFKADHTGESARMSARISEAFGGSGEVVEYETKEDMISDRISRIMRPKTKNHHFVKDAVTWPLNPGNPR